MCVSGTLRDGYASMASARAVSTCLECCHLQCLLSREFTLTGTAPGFQTSVKKLRVTPEIAARIRRGEVVSPEEIDAAARKADLKSAAEGSGGSLAGVRVIEERDDRHLINAGNKEEEAVNEWLPESVSKPSRRKKGRK